MTTRFTSLTSIQDQLRSGSLIVAEVVDHYLERIEATRDLNIYLEVYADEARQQAKAQDQLLADDPQQLPPLFGLVVSHKDVICLKDHGVQGASKILDGFESQFTATALQRLIEAGAIVIGRTNCDEMAMGSDNSHSAFGPTRNAANPEHVPGGSSGGAAVAVQADTCLVALGSDTGGSVRQPAAFCGVYGFKPTYGRISRHGLLAYGSSFDQIGLLAHSVEDVSRTLQVMAGPDEYDATASQSEVPDYARDLPASAKKIAYFPSAFEHPDLDPEIARHNQAFVDRLREQGHTVEPVDFDYLDAIIPAYYVLTTAEASSNLSRYDGVRYGHRSADATTLLDTYRKSRTEGFGPEVKKRIMLGTFVLSAGYYDAYYAQAQKVRRLIYDRTRAILEDYDFILMPASPGTAWKLGDKQEDATAMYLADIFTVQANMAGIPAMAIPLATHSNGLPVGIQLMGAPLGEHELLAFCQNL
jgi:aspartyl-tRNA(Asn)/glutamyl-tRNA(Gln) amidotransferase subunit A